MEIEGSQTYLVFRLRHLGVLSEALQFLETGKPSRLLPDRTRPGEAHSLDLGRFGDAGVSLVWDDEDFPRCFLIVGPRARSTLRLSFYEDDIAMLCDCLRQVVEELSEPGGPTGHEAPEPPADAGA